MNITNEWQTNLSLISGECREAGDLLGARLKLSFAAQKGEKIEMLSRGFIKSHLLDVCALIQDRPGFGIRPMRFSCCMDDHDNEC